MKKSFKDWMINNSNCIWGTLGVILVCCLSFLLLMLLMVFTGYLGNTIRNKSENDRLNIEQRELELWERQLELENKYGVIYEGYKNSYENTDDGNSKEDK